MNKKIVWIVFLFFLNTVNADLGGEPIEPASVSVSWITPSEESNLVGPNDSMNVKVLLTCSNGPCKNVTATLQYCEGKKCSDYSNILYGSGKLRLMHKDPDASYFVGTFLDTETADWNINWPTAIPEEKFNLKVTVSGVGKPSSITGRELEIATSDIIASILSPIDGNHFYVGKEIDFDSSISCVNSPCTVRWDSNKDTGWHSTEESFSYSGLSIGDHNISLKVTDSEGGTQTEWIIISIKPITTDVLSISNFQIIKISPSDRFSVNGTIKVRARVNYNLYETIDAKAFIIISDPRTGQAIYGPEPFYLNFTIPAYEDYDLNIDLSLYSFQERQNYKVEFLVVSNYVESSPEYFADPMDPDSAYWADGEEYFIPEEQIPEQNKANNSGNQIIELGPATLRGITQLPETNPILIALTVFAVLILLRK